MENLNKFSKSILFFTLVTFVLYSGSYLVKLVQIGQFFDAESMELKSRFVNQDLTLTLQSLLPSFSITLIFFTSFLFLYILFFVVSKINFKKDGWLFIITIIILVTTPFEAYLIFKYDWKIIDSLISSNFNQNYVLDLIKNRITNFGPFPLVLLFSNILIILLATFKPLQKVDEN